VDSNQIVDQLSDYQAYTATADSTILRVLAAVCLRMRLFPASPEAMLRRDWYLGFILADIMAQMPRKDM
jgi:hypothetical protein